MHVDPNHSVPPLRLVRPAASPPQASASRPADGGATPADPFRFESAYLSNLPRPELTDAHRRLERIRDELVAGRTNVPIHFEPPQPRPPANPYALSYERAAAVNPAERNADATRGAGDRSGD